MTPQAFLARFSSFGPLVALLGALAAAATLAGFWVSRRSPGAASTRWRLVLVDSLLVIGLFTFLPASGGGQAVNWTLGARMDLRECAANVALYVPAGFSLARTSMPRSWLAIAWLGLALPVSVEVLQHALSLGRISDVNDVLANGVGSCLGLALSGLLSSTWGRRALPPSTPTRPPAPLDTASRE